MKVGLMALPGVRLVVPGPYRSCTPGFVWRRLFCLITTCSIRIWFGSQCILFGNSSLYVASHFFLYASAIWNAFFGALDATSTPCIVIILSRLCVKPCTYITMPCGVLYFPLCVPRMLSLASSSVSSAVGEFHTLPPRCFPYHQRYANSLSCGLISLTSLVVALLHGAKHEVYVLVIACKCCW